MNASGGLLNGTGTHSIVQQQRNQCFPAIDYYLPDAIREVIFEGHTSCSYRWGVSEGTSSLCCRYLLLDLRPFRSPRISSSFDWIFGIFQKNDCQVRFLLSRRHLVELDFQTFELWTWKHQGHHHTCQSILCRSKHQTPRCSMVFVGNLRSTEQLCRVRVEGSGAVSS